MEYSSFVDRVGILHNFAQNPALVDLKLDGWAGLAALAGVEISHFKLIRGYMYLSCYQSEDGLSLVKHHLTFDQNRQPRPLNTEHAMINDSHGLSCSL